MGNSAGNSWVWLVALIMARCTAKAFSEGLLFDSHCMNVQFWHPFPKIRT